MIKVLKILLTVVVTDLYFFPLIFLAFPGTNSKMIMAVIGLGLVAFEMTRQQGMRFPGELLKLLFCAGMVSLMSLISITINQTPDKAYVTYIISACVWLSSAFTACWVIKQVHGRIDVPLLVHYLIGVCLMQSLFTMLIEYVPAFSAFVWRQTMEVLRNTEGNCYALRVPDGLGGIARLDILNPTRVTPKRNPQDQSVWYEIRMDGEELLLQPKEYAVLEYLQRSKTRYVSTEELAERIKKILKKYDKT